MRIAINAGHCLPFDIGAQGKTYNEAELAYTYAARIYNMLKEIGYSVKFICENELNDICKESNMFDADIFVSIHLNSVKGNNAVYGTEVLYCEGSINGKKLATCLQNSVKNMMIKYRLKQRQDRPVSTITDIADRGIKTNSLYVTRHTDAVAALVEIGFINNPLEEDILMHYPNEIAESVVNGILNYIANLNK